MTTSPTLSPLRLKSGSGKQAGVKMIMYGLSKPLHKHVRSSPTHPTPNTIRGTFHFHAALLELPCLCAMPLRELAKVATVGLHVLLEIAALGAVTLSVLGVIQVLLIVTTLRASLGHHGWVQFYGFARKLAELSSMFSVEHIILERLTSLSLDMCHRQAIAHSPVLAASVHYPRPGLCDSVPSKPLTTTSKALSPGHMRQPNLSSPLYNWGGGNLARIDACRNK